MKLTFQFNSQVYAADTSAGIDLSLAVSPNEPHASAWYVDPPIIEPVRMGDWTGEVRSGAAVNFRNIFFNPHGHGTHTECYGHISKEDASVNQLVRDYLMPAQLISIQPDRVENDELIRLSSFEKISLFPVKALIIRTLPNPIEKRNRNWSNSNPPYLSAEVAAWLADHAIEHLLIDLPSVDREKDEGRLSAHKAFWRYEESIRTSCSITEFIFVPDTCADGLYLLNLQIAAFENDAAPSRPLIWPMVKA